MRLVYKDTGVEVKVGDRVKTTKGEDVVVKYFRKPHSPASEGRVTIAEPDDDRGGNEFYVSVIGAEWIEREDRPDDDEIEVVEAQNEPKSPEKGINITIANLDAFKFEAVHDSDNDWVLYSPDVESCEGNSREQMDNLAAVVNQAPGMLRALRELRSTAYDYLDADTLKLLSKLDHIE